MDKTLIYFVFRAGANQKGTSAQVTWPDGGFKIHASHLNCPASGKTTRDGERWCCAARGICGQWSASEVGRVAYHKLGGFKFTSYVLMRSHDVADHLLVPVSIAFWLMNCRYVGCRCSEHHEMIRSRPCPLGHRVAGSTHAPCHCLRTGNEMTGYDW